MRDSNLKNDYQGFRHLAVSNGAAYKECNDLTNEQTETLIMSMEDLVLVLDADRNFVKCFQPESPSLLMSPALFIGKNLAEIPFPQDVMELMQHAFDAAANTGIAQTINYCLTIDSRIRWFNSKISVVDKLNGFIVVARDVTEWMESLQQLEANERKYYLLADNTTDLVALYAPDGTIEYISPSVYRLLGHKPEDLLGADPSVYIHPEDLLYIQQNFLAESYTGDAFFSAEYRLLHANGHWVSFHTNRKPIRNEKGEIMHILACCRDITERVQFDEALKQSEVYYKMLADHILDLVGLHDVEGVFEYVSPSSLTVLGYSPDELIGRNAFDLIHPDEAASLFENNSNKAAEGRDTFIDEFRILHKHGHYVYFETTTKIIRNKDNEPVKFLSTSRDITEWKKAQHALKESEEKYRSLIESSDNIVIMVNANNQYLFVNNRAAAFIGVNPENIIGKKIGEVLYSGQEEGLIRNIQKVIAEERVIWSEYSVVIGGTQYWVRSSLHPIRNSEGKIYAVLLNAIDISNLKRTEALLAEQNKGLREIAFLQSHVLRSPLSNIKHLISLLDKKNLSEENKIILDLLQISADNLDDVVKQIVEKTYLSEK